MNASPNIEVSFNAALALGFGMPDERAAQIAARRAFVDMKQCFMRAAADIDGNVGAVLQRQVRNAGEPMHLWRLRAPILASLAPNHQRTPAHRSELARQLDTLFPVTDTRFVPL